MPVGRYRKGMAAPLLRRRGPFDRNFCEFSCGRAWCLYRSGGDRRQHELHEGPAQSREPAKDPLPLRSARGVFPRSRKSGLFVPEKPRREARSYGEFPGRADGRHRCLPRTAPKCTELSSEPDRNRQSKGPQRRSDGRTGPPEKRAARRYDDYGSRTDASVASLRWASQEVGRLRDQRKAAMGEAHVDRQISNS